MNVPSFRFSFRGFWQMYPRSGFRTSECTLVPVFVPGEHPLKPPFWKTTLLENHPFWKTTLLSTPDSRWFQRALEVLAVSICAQVTYRSVSRHPLYGCWHFRSAFAGLSCSKSLRDTPKTLRALALPAMKALGS